MRLAVSILLLFSIAACDTAGGDDDRPTQTVPADVRPEDAMFKYAVRNNRLNVLSVRLSKISLCERNAVPDGHTYVQIEVAVPLGQTVGPGSYTVDGLDVARVTLQSTQGAACSGAAGLGASDGVVTLDEVTPSSVRGSFVGTNADTKLDLRGSFVAAPCPGNPSQICL
jgi:hypothetical protein